MHLYASAPADRDPLLEAMLMAVTSASDGADQDHVEEDEDDATLIRVPTPDGEADEDDAADVNDDDETEVDARTS